MKINFLILLSILSIVILSCDDGVKFDNPNDQNADISDSSDSQNDEDKDSTDTIADEDSNEQSDSENSDKKQGELDGECYPNKTCNDGLICDKDNNICIKDSESSENNDDDSDTTPEQGDDNNDADTTPDNSDSTPDEEDTDADFGDSTPDEDTDTDSGDSAPDQDTDTDTAPTTPCDPNPCDSVANSTQECSLFGGTTYKCECTSDYYWDGSTCGTTQTQTATCTGLISGAEWNTVSEIIQTWDDYLGTWIPTANGSYNENPSTNQCKYKCREAYVWQDTKCVTPCDANSCSSDPNLMCVATSVTDYTCECKIGSTWNETESKCIVDPAHLPECSPKSATPCYDSTSHLTWSKKSSDTMSYSAATSYCSGSEMNGYGGYSDWRLPNISELRTLIKNCSGTQMPNGTCGVTDDCLSSECRNDDCGGCTYDENNPGQYSKFGDTGSVYFWSSSIVSDYSLYYIWSLNFKYGLLSYHTKTDSNYVRCVR